MLNTIHTRELQILAFKWKPTLATIKCRVFKHLHNKSKDEILFFWKQKLHGQDHLYSTNNSTPYHLCMPLLCIYFAHNQPESMLRHTWNVPYFHQKHQSEKLLTNTPYWSPRRVSWPFITFTVWPLPTTPPFLRWGFQLLVKVRTGFFGQFHTS